VIEGRTIWDKSRMSDRARMELTDLIRFKGCWYCGFREGDIHMSHPSGRGRIIRSADGLSWESVALFEWDGADVREPKLSVTAEGLLMANTTVYFVSREPREGGHHYQLDAPGTPETVDEAEVARQSVTWLSRDGKNWSGAYACPSGVNSWRWEAAWHGGMGYCVGYGGKDKKGCLYRTRDGRNWRALRENLFPGGHGNEASLSFGPDGTVCLLLRDGQPRVAGQRRALRQSDGHEIAPGQARVVHGTHAPMLGAGKPPRYQEWEWREIRVDWNGDGALERVEDVFAAPFGGPKLIRLKDGRLVAAGRVLGPGRDDGHVTLFWVDRERAVLKRFAEFAGTSYPGVVEHEGMIWVSSCASDASAVFLAQVATPG